MKILNLFTILLIGCLWSGCKIFSCQTKADNANEWNNPPLNCDIPGVADDIFIEEGESSLEGEEGLKDFCSRMQEHFSVSNMSRQEARKVYDLLLDSGKLQDESFDMPSPDDPPAQITDFSSRAAIQKTDDDHYEVFIILSGGGFTYFHGAFKWPQEPQQLQLQPIEVWRASYPW